MSPISFCRTTVVTVGLLLYSFVFCARGKINVINAENKTVDSFIDFEWEYGASLKKIGMMGYAVKAQPVNGCDPITKPPFPSNSSMRWFVLIRRYECSIELKVRIAQAANYDGAILYPYDIPEMQSFSAGTHSDLYDNDITIPAFFITETDGQIILNKYLYQSGYYLYILPEEPFNILAYIIPFVIAIGLCFLVLILFVIIKCIREHRKNQRNRLPSRHLKQLPVIKFKKGDQYDVCAICLEEYNEGNKLRVLPCSHAYHTKCIDPWLTNNRRTCPICKQKVRLSGESSDSESDSETDTPNETTPLLRSLAGRTVGRLSSNFMRNPVINSNQPDVIENSSAVGESSQSAPQERSTLEQQADPSSNQLTCVELHNPSECHTNGTYSSSAPPCSSGMLSPSMDNNPSGENVRRVVEVATPESNSSSESENSQRKDMIV